MSGPIITFTRVVSLGPIVLHHFIRAHVCSNDGRVGGFLPEVLNPHAIPLDVLRERLVIDPGPFQLGLQPVVRFGDDSSQRPPLIDEGVDFRFREELCPFEHHLRGIQNQVLHLLLGVVEGVVIQRMLSYPVRDPRDHHRHPVAHYGL